MGDCWSFGGKSRIPGFVAAAVATPIGDLMLFRDLRIDHPALLHAYSSKIHGLDNLYIDEPDLPYGLTSSDILFRQGDLGFPFPFTINGIRSNFPNSEICITRECLAANLGFSNTWRYFGHNLFDAYVKDFINADALMNAAWSMHIRGELSENQFKTLLNDAAKYYLEEGKSGSQIAACKIWSLLAHSYVSDKMKYA